jgi:hypothetical protein
MLRFAAFAAALLMAAAAKPAAAEDAGITVKIAGRSEAAVQADIRKAVHEVCANADDFQIGVPQTVDVAQCERITIRKAMARLDQAVAARAASSQVAKLSRPAKGEGR